MARSKWQRVHAQQKGHDQNASTTVAEPLPSCTNLEEPPAPVTVETEIDHMIESIGTSVECVVVDSMRTLSQSIETGHSVLSHVESHLRSETLESESTTSNAERELATLVRICKGEQCERVGAVLARAVQIRTRLARK